MRAMLLCTAACAAFFPHLAGAQTTEQSSANAAQGAAVSPAAPENGAGLVDIIVTAQRIEENSQRTPLAVDVIQPEELTRQNVLRAEDLSRISPSLSASGGGGPTTVFFVRGVGNSTVNSYSDPAISFNYDGVYIGRPTSTSGVFYDLQRVEVLKGPQGTLYGRNATAGAINVIPNRPRLGETSGNFTLGYGNYDWITGQAALNVPIGDMIAVRAAGTVASRDGFQTDGTGNQREHGGRLQIYAEPSPDLSIRIGADFAHQGGASSSGFYLGAVNPTFGPGGFAGYQFVPSNFSTQQGLLDPASNAYLAPRFFTQLGRAGAVVDGVPYNDNDYWGITAELNYTTPAGTLTVQPAYREADLEYAFNGTFRQGYTKEKDKQTSVEARWAGDIGSSVDYLIGAMYFDEEISATARYNQQTLSPYQDFATRTESWAGFGKITFRPVENLSLTAGGRYTSDKKRFDGTSNVYIAFCGNPAPPQDFCPTLPFIPLAETEAELQAFYGSLGIPITPVPLFALPPIAGGSQTAPFILRSQIAINSGLANEKFTYRLAAQYDFSPRNMVYASFETGYHAGGFSFARGLDTYRPETIKAYTIGTKNRFFDNRVQLNVEAFLWKYKDQQFSQFGYDLGNPPSTVFLTRNIGDSTIKGIDVDVEFLATENTLLSANVQYLDTKYDSFVYFAPNQGLPPNTTCPFSPTTQTTPGGTINVFRIDCSGNQAFNSPKWSFNLDAQQTIPLGDYKAVVQGGTRYRGSSYSTADYLPYLRSEATFVSYASLTLATEDDRLFFSVYVNNIEDNRRLITGTATSASLISASAEQPRTYGFRIGGKF
ncbi:MAG: TonB-dependent receptor [Alphaproteobacteria bacterium]|nr:TonB-dependent receptor [Alphaproteobacteria bacterium]MBU0794224.1 TonB-dependent receptor [Alphaproteobacteria bacterium]MBU0876575.1 TonB-dependent receptor [Alphaproteobacteria bacterium]MBU1769276.1 TonB-dependent receptor [Alphaproteobacteria bacterium]